MKQKINKLFNILSYCFIFIAAIFTITTINLKENPKEGITLYNHQMMVVETESMEKNELVNVENCKIKSIKKNSLIIVKIVNEKDPYSFYKDIEINDVLTFKYMVGNNQETITHRVINKISKDEGFMKVYSLIINVTILMTTFGVLIGTLIIEFVVPLFLKNGQTLGKKCFGICVMHQNGVKIRTTPLLVRALLGKFTIELMIPIYIGIMFIFGSISILQIFILLALVVAEIAMIITNRYNALIHDAMSFTVVVDKESQMIFDTEDDLIRYKEEKAQEQLENTKTF